MTADDLTALATSVLVERTVALARQEPVLQSDEVPGRMFVSCTSDPGGMSSTSRSGCAPVRTRSRELSVRTSWRSWGCATVSLCFPSPTSLKAVSLLCSRTRSPSWSLRRCTRLATSDEASHRSLHDYRSMLQKTFAALSRTPLAAAMTPSPSPR